jgi:hypothetical protein
MFLEKIPYDRGGVEILARLSDENRRQIFRPLSHVWPPPCPYSFFITRVPSLGSASGSRLISGVEEQPLWVAQKKTARVSMIFIVLLNFGLL